MSALPDTPTKMPSLDFQGGPAGAEVSSFTPRSVSEADRAIAEHQFAFRFAETMAGRGKSLLASDVYHETPAHLIEAGLAKHIFTREEHRDLQTILSGHAWQSVSKAKFPYVEQLIESAVDEGLINRIKGQKIRFSSMGPGPNGTVDRQEGQIIRALLENGRDIVRFNAIDKNRSYASGASGYIGDKYNINAHGILGDFVWGKPGGLPLGPKDADTVDVVAVFGNTPFNAASFDHDDKRLSYKDSVENFFAKINVQHGLGHYLILSVDTDQDPKTQLKNYAVTREHEQLILTPYALARLNGHIKDPYPIFAHQRMSLEFDEEHSSVLMLAEAKDNHTMRTLHGDFAFAAGETRVVMGSQKLGPESIGASLGNVGYEVVGRKFTRSHNPHILILARSVKMPHQEPF